MLALDPTAADLLFYEAHTANGFAADPVTDEQIAEIWNLIRWAPTSGNSSPARLLLVRSAQARQRLARHMSESNRDKTLAAPLTVVAAADLRFHELWPRVAPHRAESAARLEGDPATRERLSVLSATLQTGYFILGVRAAGLAAGPMGGFDRDGVDREFFAEDTWRSLVVINVGRPAAGGHRERLPRLEFADVARVV